MRIIYPDRIENGFIYEFLRAKDEVKKTGKSQPIQGFRGWKVSPVKKEDFDE